jgi:hypothetical protein
MNDQAPSDPLAGVDWGEVSVQAAVIVSACTPARDVGDVVQQGLLLVLEGEAPWDPADGKTLGEHAAAVGIRAYRNARRTERRRKDPKIVAKLVMEFDVPPLTPEGVLAQGYDEWRKETCTRRVIESLADDKQATAVLELARHGVGEVAEQARLSGYSLRAVERARSRISRRAEEVAQQFEEEEESP